MSAIERNDFLPNVSLVSMVLAMFIFLLPGFKSDLALARGHACFGNTQWFGGCNPYSVLWYLLNPGYWLQTEYKAYVIGLICVMSLVYWKLYKRGTIGFVMLYCWIFQNIVWLALHITENVTITLFAPLAAINPLFALLIPLQKLPLGWSWNLSDYHWHCAFTFPGGWTTNIPECTGFDRWGFFSDTSGLVYTYIMIIIWFVVPSIIWFRNRRVGKARKANALPALVVAAAAIGYLVLPGGLNNIGFAMYYWLGVFILVTYLMGGAYRAFGIKVVHIVFDVWKDALLWPYRKLKRPPKHVCEVTDSVECLRASREGLPYYGCGQPAVALIEYIPDPNEDKNDPLVQLRGILSSGKPFFVCQEHKDGFLNNSCYRIREREN